MTHQDSQELRAYLDQRFDGIDKHLERQDIDFNNTTKNLLLTIQDATDADLWR